MQSVACFLALPPELRVQIFTTIFRDILTSAHRVPSPQLLIQDVPWDRPRKLNTLSYLLLNRTLHAEAEDAFWTLVDSEGGVILQTVWLYKYPRRALSLQTLSTFAYRNIKKLTLPIYVRSDNNFAHIRIVGTASPTFRFDKLAAELGCLEELTLPIVMGAGLDRYSTASWIWWRTPGIVGDIVRRFGSRVTVIVAEKEDMIDGVRKELKEWVRGRRVEFRLDSCKWSR
ncbi:hypothetical protein EJ04DRAFT_513168 [Polyplosphaeria fusca]|uniref:Uncharacterized protein n=1 Tax=Polyplosphaeria fusca TaxID=682080 RepID=A0A9P4QXW3_9PLEO|nr:hypothetical protein EJ04DRAFT_513168 [Polyplosphaeria fusca]